MITTYLEIIIPTIFFIVFVCENISRIMTYVTIFLLLCVLGSFSFTACSDPGIIFLDEYEIDPETPPSNQAIQCTQCQVIRPSTARHCYHCGVCVDKVCKFGFFFFLNYFCSSSIIIAVSLENVLERRIFIPFTHLLDHYTFIVCMSLG
jgi:hypothetical protein